MTIISYKLIFRINRIKKKLFLFSYFLNRKTKILKHDINFIHSAHIQTRSTKFKVIRIHFKSQNQITNDSYHLQIEFNEK